jgi:hypothetical protein
MRVPFDMTTHRELVFLGVQAAVYIPISLYG